MESISFTGVLQESKRQQDTSGFLWEVAVIGEGPGLNSQRGTDGKLYREYFTRESIEDLTTKLEGVKVKAFRFREGSSDEKRNHLPITLDRKLGNKSVGNNVGVLENPSSGDVNGRLHSFAQLRLSDHDGGVWLRDMLVWAHDTGHPDYLGLSINSTGVTRQRIEESTGTRYLDVLKINRPKSVEVVDTPAAKGEVQAQFVRLLQSYQEREKENMEVNEEKKDEQATSLADGSEEQTSAVQGDQEETTDSQSEEHDGDQPVVESDETLKQDGTESRDEQEKQELPSKSTPHLMESRLNTPLKLYLDKKDIMYEGETVAEIVESLDVTGLDYLDQAAIKELKTLVKGKKMNAARRLIDEMVNRLYRLESALGYVDEMNALGLIKQSQNDPPQENTLVEASQDAGTHIHNDSEDGSTETDTGEPHIELQSTAPKEENVSLTEGESGDVNGDSKTMEVTDVKNGEITEQAGVEKAVVEGEKAEESTAASTDPPQGEPKKDEPSSKVSEGDMASVDSGKLDKLIESLGTYSTAQAKRVEELEKELQEERSLREADAQMRSEMRDVLTELRNQREHERMDRILEQSGLMPPIIEEIRDQLDGKVVSSKDLETLIDRKKRTLVQIQESSPEMQRGNVQGLGWSELRMGANANDKLQVAMHRLFGVDKGDDKNEAWSEPGYRFSGLRQGYNEITGDINVTGFMADNYIRQGVIGHDTFEKTLSNTMNRYLVNWYDTFEQSWRSIIRVRTGIHDFKTQEMNRVGGFGNLQMFSDTMASPSPTGYAEATPPIEQSGAFRPRIRGLMFTITEEMIKNDDLFIITRLLEESARSADETLMTFVFGLLVGGATYLENNNAEYVPSSYINSDDIYSGAHLRKLFGADNSGTAALNYWPLLDAISQIKRMKKIGNGKPLRLYGKKYLVIPLELEHTALKIHPNNSELEPNGSDNQGNIIPKNLEIIAVDKMYLGDDPNNWYLVEDPMRWEGIQVGFVDDEQNPRIVLANNPTAGRTFSHGGLQYTVTHRYGGGVAGHEGLYASLV